MAKKKKRIVNQADLLLEKREVRLGPLLKGKIKFFEDVLGDFTYALVSEEYDSSLRDIEKYLEEYYGEYGEEQLVDKLTDMVAGKLKKCPPDYEDLEERLAVFLEETCRTEEDFSTRELEVIGWVYGIASDKLTMEDVGRRLDKYDTSHMAVAGRMSRERVRQIKEGAIKKLKKYRGGLCEIRQQYIERILSQEVLWDRRKKKDEEIHYLMKKYDLGRKKAERVRKVMRFVYPEDKELLYRGLSKEELIKKVKETKYYQVLSNEGLSLNEMAAELNVNYFTADMYRNVLKYIGLVESKYNRGEGVNAKLEGKL